MTGVAWSTTLVTLRSATLGVTVALALSSLGSGSVALVDVIVTTFVLTVGPRTSAVMVSVSTAPRESRPTFHTPLVLSKLPAVVVAPTNPSAAGRSSVAATMSAASGPSLVRVIVNVTWSPTSGVGSSTVLVSPRSASGALSVALSWSSSPGTPLAGVESGSVWSTAVTSAVLVIAPVAVTCAVSWSCAEAPTARSPTVHAPDASS